MLEYALRVMTTNTGPAREIREFVRNTRGVLMGFQPHGADLKSGKCLAFWPHEPHERHGAA